jgi:hypothetical protein
MSRKGNSHGDVFTQIDALDEARTVAELVARLKPILNHLAYYAVTGEGAVLEAHEQWHTEYTDRLYEETDSDNRAGRAALPPQHAEHLPPPAPTRRPKQRTPAEQAIAEADAREARAGRRQAAPPPNRPRADALPPSLQAIMDGTHASFKDSD